MIRRVVLMATCLFGCAPGSAVAQSRLPTEYEIKAVFLYQFGKFVEWPASSAGGGEPFTICVLGEDPFGIVLDETIRGQAILGRVLVAKRIVAIKDAGTCRILFISPSEDSRLPEILGALERKSVLTVGEGSQFTRRGGMINFKIEENRVRFAINLAATERAGLKVSSQLLKVASIVETQKGGS